MCGCGGSIKRTSGSTRNRVTTSSSSTVVTGCRSMYNELADLDIKIIALLKLDSTDTIYRESNTQVRVWIRNLGVECPPGEEYQTLKEYIENEYTINFS